MTSKVLLDDGIRYSEDPAGATENYVPTWLDESTVTYVRRVGQQVAHLVVVDADLNEELTEIPLPSAVNELGRERTVIDVRANPVVVDTQTVLLGAYEQLWGVDIAGREVVEIPVRFPRTDRGAVLPEHVVAGSHLWLMDFQSMNHALSSGTIEGVVSGAYRLDLSDGVISPMFDSASSTRPIVGPLRVWIDEPNERFVVMIVQDSGDGAWPPYKVRCLAMPNDADWPLGPADLTEAWVVEDAWPNMPNGSEVIETLRPVTLITSGDGTILLDTASK